MLSINNITFKYGESDDLIFEDFSLELKENQITAILGPSGSGKTTLANLVAGYLKPDKGEIILDNNKITNPGRDRVVINQENDLFDWMNVYQNLKLVTNNNNLISSLLQLTQLEEYGDYYPAKLSGGMKKRLSFARALAVESKFVIMDEPFGSQDINIKSQMHKELLKIAKSQKKTILLITHDIDEACFLSDRIIVISGRPLKIIKDYCAPFFGDQKEEGSKDDVELLRKQLILLGYNIK
jgi:ABC-type nitrate/sulfonate/bicarbonate transport system ATPase subunit